VRPLENYWIITASKKRCLISTNQATLFRGVFLENYWSMMCMARGLNCMHAPKASRAITKETCQQIEQTDCMEMKRRKERKNDLI
jgi:hypothetical protein